jgi:hypothetical protein
MLRNILIANALIRLSPFIVVGGLLLTVTRCGSIDPANLTDSAKPECSEAMKSYEKDLGRGNYVAQEILCGRYDTERNPELKTPECLGAAYAYVKGMKGSGDAMEINCSVSTTH